MKTNRICLALLSGLLLLGAGCTSVPQPAPESPPGWDVQVKLGTLKSTSSLSAGLSKGQLQHYAVASTNRVGPQAQQAGGLEGTNMWFRFLVNGAPVTSPADLELLTPNLHFPLPTGRMWRLLQKVPFEGTSGTKHKFRLSYQNKTANLEATVPQNTLDFPILQNALLEPDRVVVGWSPVKNARSYTVIVDADTNPSNGWSLVQHVPADQHTLESNNVRGWIDSEQEYLIMVMANGYPIEPSLQNTFYQVDSVDQAITARKVKVFVPGDLRSVPASFVKGTLPGQQVEAPFELHAGIDHLEYSVSVESGADFIQLQQPAGRVSGHQTANVGVKLQCAGVGIREGKLKVVTDDPDHPAFSVPVKLKCMNPLSIGVSAEFPWARVQNDFSWSPDGKKLLVIDQEYATGLQHILIYDQNLKELSRTIRPITRFGYTLGQWIDENRAVFHISTNVSDRQELWDFSSGPTITELPLQQGEFTIIGAMRDFITHSDPHQLLAIPLVESGGWISTVLYSRDLKVHQVLRNAAGGAFDPTGERLAYWKTDVWTNTSQLQVVHPVTGATLFQKDVPELGMNVRGLKGLVWHPDGIHVTLAVSSEDRKNTTLLTVNTSTGQHSHFVTPGELHHFQVDGAGHVYVIGWYDRRILKLDATGKVLASFGFANPNPTTMNRTDLVDLRFDPSTRLLHVTVNQDQNCAYPSTMFTLDTELKLQQSGPPTGCAFSQVAMNSQGGVLLTNGQWLYHLKDSREVIPHASISNLVATQLGLDTSNLATRPYLLSPSGVLAIDWAPNEIMVVENNKVRRLVAPANSSYFRLHQISPDGKYATMHDMNRWEHLAIVDLSTGAVVRKFGRAVDLEGNSVGWVDDHTFLYLNKEELNNWKISLYNPQDGSEKHLPAPDFFYFNRVAGGGNSVVLAHSHHAFLLNPATAELRKLHTLDPQGQRSIEGLLVDHSNSRLYMLMAEDRFWGSSRSVNIADLESGFVFSKANVGYTFSFDQHGSQLVSAGWPDAIKLLNVK